MVAEAELRARSRGENFTVASRLLPRASREHLLAFYAYARLVDELGDSYQGDRLSALDQVERELEAALTRPEGGTGVVAKAASSVTTLGADPSPLFRLIAANRQDQAVSSYRTFSELLGYCELSANPVGHLVLAAFGLTGEERVRCSDAICTGLQLAEHWQDVAEDARAGRVYIPVDDLARFGVDPSELAGPGPASRQLRSLMVFEVARARRFLDEGAGLIHDVPGRCRWAVAGFWAGGHAALDAIAARRFDVLAGAPRPSRLRTTARALAALAGAGAGREAA